MSRRLLCAAVWCGWLLLTPAAARGQAVEESERESLSGDHGPAPAGGPDLAKAAALIVEKTNAFRKEQGRGPVKVNEKLAATATYFADYMARTGEYGHEADGQKPAERATKHGYDYCIVLENIAYVYDPSGFTTEKLADWFTTGWKNSPGHRKNMLDPDVVGTGVAVARSEKTGYYYAVQMFGRPKSQAIEFQIENRSGETIEYAAGDKTFTLPPRYTRTHRRCRPADVTFRWPGNQKPTTVSPATGDDFVISGDRGALRVGKK